MAGCIYCGKTGKRLCDSCAERLKMRNLQFLFPLSSSDVSAISAICKPKPEPQKAVWTASSDTANKNTASRTYTSVKQPKVTASKPTSVGSVVSPRNNDVQYDGQYRLLKAPIGNYTGKGKYTSIFGSVYEGNFVDGRLTGRGKHTSPNGDICEGNFVDGKLTGKGMCKYINGDFYEGDFVNDERTGKGKFIWSNGETYEGDFVDGKRTGKGKYTWTSGNVYEGDFVDGKLVGKGKFTWASGNVYEGNCLDSNFNSKGKLIWKNGDIYEGDFVNDKRTGKGKYTWTSGNVYEGDFVNDKRTGKGKETFANGDIYEGDFVDGKRTGHGVCRFANGEKYIGDFIDGKRQGYGVQYDKTGVAIYRGNWENDILVENPVESLLEMMFGDIQGEEKSDNHANNSHTSNTSPARTASAGRSNANNTIRDNSEDTVSDISALVVLLAGAGILLGLILAAIFTPWHIGQWFASSLVSIAVLVGFIISSSLGSYFYFHNVFFLLFSSANIVLRFYFQAAYKPFFILVSIALFISFVYLMFCEFDFDEKRRGRITLLIESVSLLIQFLFLFAGEDWFYDTLFPFFEQIFTYVKDLL